MLISNEYRSTSITVASRDGSDHTGVKKQAARQIILEAQRPLMPLSSTTGMILMSGTDMHAQSTSEKDKHPERCEPKVEQKFIRSAAEEAYKNFLATSHRAIDAELNYDSTSRTWALGFIELIHATFPKPVLDMNRHFWDNDPVREFELPEEIVKFLKSKGYDKIHGGAANPFLALAIGGVLKVKLEKKLLTTKEATEALAAAQDPVKQRKALNSRISLWAKFGLGIVDMERPDLADKPVLNVVAEYDKWRPKHATLSGKPYSRGGASRKSQSIKDERAEQDKNLREILASGVKRSVDDDDLDWDDDPVTATPHAAPEIVTTEQTTQAARESPKTEDSSRPETDIFNFTSTQPKAPEPPSETFFEESHVVQDQLNCAAQPGAEPEETPIGAKMLAQLRPLAVTEAADWFSFASAFDRPTAPVQLKVGRNVKIKIGMEDAKAGEVFLRCKIGDDGEWTIIGMRREVP